jgi:hypothetical protein
MSVSILLYLLDLRIPILALKARFNPQDINSFLNTGQVTLYSLFRYIRRIPEKRCIWSIDYVKWLFDDCEISLDSIVMLWTDKRDDEQPTYNIYPLDFICISRNQLPIRELLDYFLSKKAPSCVNYSWLLKFFYGLCDNDEEWCAKRLLDAGATSKYIDPVWDVSIWYETRQTRRKECLLFIGIVTRRRQDLLHLVLPRDVLQLIGKQIWTQRYSQEDKNDN